MTDPRASAKRRLYLASVDDRFDPSRDIALGPWCFSGKEEIFPDWQSLTFDDPFLSVDEAGAAAEDCAVLAAYQLQLLRNELNRRHGRDYSQKFWWCVTMRWLHWLVTVTWRRWCTVAACVEKLGDAPLEVVITHDAEAIQWGFTDTYDFNNGGLLSPAFDLWLYSLCVRRLAPPSWVLHTETLVRDSLVVVVPPLRTNRLRQFLSRCIRHLPFRDVPGTSAFALGSLSLLAMLMPKHPERAAFHGPSPTEVPPVFPAAYLNLLEVALAATMPASFTTRFAALEDRARQVVPVPGRLLVTCADTSNDASNIRIAHLAEGGERIVRVQHGSDYGTMDHATIEWLTEYVYDCFLTWGWTGQSGRNGRFVPAPSFGLSRVMDRHREREAAIILVGTRIRTRSARVDYLPQPSHWGKYTQDKVTFIQALAAAPRHLLRLRLYGRSNNDLDERTFLTSRLGAFHEVVGSDFERHILSCRLLVLDHPGTTLNISMAANTPTICYWGDDLWPYAAEARPLFLALKKVGIIHATPAAAAAHINAIHGDVAGWWHSAEVQRARRAWVDRYALAKRASVLEWAKVLYRL